MTYETKNLVFGFLFWKTTARFYIASRPLHSVQTSFGYLQLKYILISIIICKNAPCFFDEKYPMTIPDFPTSLLPHFATLNLCNFETPYKTKHSKFTTQNFLLLFSLLSFLFCLVSFLFCLVSFTYCLITFYTLQLWDFATLILHSKLNTQNFLPLFSLFPNYSNSL